MFLASSGRAIATNADSVLTEMTALQCLRRNTDIAVKRVSLYRIETD